MPCEPLRRRYDNRKTPQTVVNVPATTPFYKAAVTTLLVNKKIKFKRDVVKVVMRDRDTLKIYIRSVGFTTLKIDDLHDMAVLFVPQPKPGSPVTVDYLAAHFHPKAPKDLKDVPLKDQGEFWRWKAVGDIYVKEYYTPEPVVETAIAETKRKLIMRLVEVREIPPDTKPFRQEKVLQEEEVKE